MAHYAIGDVQGCYSELKALLEVIHFDENKDYLYFVGDLVNRGPQSLAVLRFVKALEERATVVLGNHDLHLLAVAAKKDSIRDQDTFKDVLSAADSEDLLQWLRLRPLVHFNPVHNFLMVHAGIAPSWDVATLLTLAAEVESVLAGPNYGKFFKHMYGDEPKCWNDDLEGWDRLRTITNYLTRMRFCKPDGTLKLSDKGGLHSAPPGFIPWFQHPALKVRQYNLVFGHWAAIHGVTETPGAFCLDTGCVWGHRLTALNLENLALYSVPSSLRPV